MKLTWLRLSVAVLSITTLPAARAQVISDSIVGYINRQLSPGDNLVANQLINGGNTLNEVLISGLPTGATFTEWDPASHQLLPYSYFDASSQTWSINYTFNLGDGGILHTPVTGTTTFVGTVDVHESVGGLVSDYVIPVRGPGLYLIASGLPIAASFQDVVGRDPVNGEWVQTLDEVSQSYSRTTFYTGTGWDNGTPTLAVAQSAWFDLGPTPATVPALVPVPEPSVAALAGASVLALAFARRSRR